MSASAAGPDHRLLRQRRQPEAEHVRAQSGSRPMAAWITTWWAPASIGLPPRMGAVRNRTAPTHLLARRQLGPQVPEVGPQRHPGAGDPFGAQALGDHPHLVQVAVGLVARTGKGVEALVGLAGSWRPRWRAPR